MQVSTLRHVVMKEKQFVFVVAVAISLSYFRKHLLSSKIGTYSFSSTRIYNEYATVWNDVDVVGVSGWKSTSRFLFDTEINHPQLVNEFDKEITQGATTVIHNMAYVTYNMLRLDSNDTVVIRARLPLVKDPCVKKIIKMIPCRTLLYTDSIHFIYQKHDHKKASIIHFHARDISFPDVVQNGIIVIFDIGCFIVGKKKKNHLNNPNRQNYFYPFKINATVYVLPITKFRKCFCAIRTERSPFSSFISSSMGSIECSAERKIVSPCGTTQLSK
ncbi:hypothetical protein BDA99DRAFT_575384 [Phascolomyces articulosus]|uniref:Uncharacterized protein n=1 Tax=Phascolomyces articulosus TaxID=60185 RepID=A0AAD5K0M8_9FUNG|nr:hypothetical protein BDA99DRAFT_575384 [Phascolomyces articulosus]